MTPKELTWAAGEHPFALSIDLLRALQQRCDAGPMWVKTRLETGHWMVDDVVSTIRLGLEGGGLEKAEARKLVKLHVEDRPLTESVLLAKAILELSLFGDPEDMPGERAAGTEE